MDAIKSIYKGRLVGTVLSGYLSLRKLVVQRTKLIDDTQDKFLELLEDMTSGMSLIIFELNSVDFCLFLYLSFRFFGDHACIILIL